MAEEITVKIPQTCDEKRSIFTAFKFPDKTLPELEKLLLNNEVQLRIAVDQKKTVGFILWYSHYSTWTGESVVIRHLESLGNNTAAKMALTDSVLSYCKEKGVTRCDVFTSDQGLKDFLVTANFTNLSVNEDWDCWSLAVQ